MMALNFLNQGGYAMKRAALIAALFVSSAISQVWAEGVREIGNPAWIMDLHNMPAARAAVEAGRHRLHASGVPISWNREVHPGARVILETRGYRFGANNNPISYRSHPITDFPHENALILNPHVYDRNALYLANLDVYQWVEASVFATTGVAHLVPGTHIFIPDIADRFLRRIGNSVQNALLAYIGTQTFQMADGSLQELPVFQLVDLFNDTAAQALLDFYKAFEAGILFKSEGYEYSAINNRFFARDIKTGRELRVWGGKYWILYGDDRLPFLQRGYEEPARGYEYSRLMMGAHPARPPSVQGTHPNLRSPAVRAAGETAAPR
jgi:hypothetical protein